MRLAAAFWADHTQNEPRRAAASILSGGNRLLWVRAPGFVFSEGFSTEMEAADFLIDKRIFSRILKCVNVYVNNYVNIYFTRYKSNKYTLIFGKRLERRYPDLSSTDPGFPEYLIPFYPLPCKTAPRRLRCSKVSNKS